MKAKFIVVIWAAALGMGLVLGGCGAPSVPSIIPQIIPPQGNPTKLQISAQGSDVATGTLNLLEFDKFSGSASTADLSFTATSTQTVQVLLNSSSANSGCDLNDVQTAAEWTPAGGSATHVQTGNAVLPGDNYTVTAGTTYNFRFIATPATGCQNASFAFAVIPQ